ncbi:hypothetical protein GCM10007886_52160 [Methylobacterium gregans]|nr:hypothetical protein GCM10007886_52160 [Methylobacterium gregans]
MVNDDATNLASNHAATKEIEKKRCTETCKKKIIIAVEAFKKKIKWNSIITNKYKRLLTETKKTS